VSKKATIELKPKRGISQAGSELEKNILGKESSMCKGPEKEMAHLSI
jgi:hypothetical protein